MNDLKNDLHKSANILMRFKDTCESVWDKFDHALKDGQLDEKLISECMEIISVFLADVWLDKCDEDTYKIHEAVSTIEHALFEGESGLYYNGLLSDNEIEHCGNLVDDWYYMHNNALIWKCLIQLYQCGYVDSVAQEELIQSVYDCIFERQSSPVWIISDSIEDFHDIRDTSGLEIYKIGSDYNVSEDIIDHAISEFIRCGKDVESNAFKAFLESVGGDPYFYKSVPGIIRMLKEHPDLGSNNEKVVETSSFMTRMEDIFEFATPQECYNAAEIIDVVEQFFIHFESDINLYKDSASKGVVNLPDDIYELNYYDVNKLEGKDLDVFYGKMACVKLRDNMLYLDILQYALQMRFDLEGGIYKYLLDEVKQLRGNIIRVVLQDGVNYYNATNSASMVVGMKPTVGIGVIYALLKSIRKESVEDILQVKKRFTAAWLSAGDDVEEIDYVVEQIVDAIREKVHEEDDWKRIKSRVQNEIMTYGSLISLKEITIPNSFITSLSTGEYLFDKYIIKDGAQKDFDYSFISIMYYTALENLVNGTIYAPYIRSVEENLKNVPGNRIGDYFSDKKDPRNQKIKNKFLKYDKDKSILYPIEAVEIGTIGILLKEIKKIREFKLFLNDIGMTNDQIISLQNFGGDLCEAANYRNKAAHGSSIIEVNEAIADKNRTYAIERVGEYKAYIIELLKILSNRQ